MAPGVVRGLGAYDSLWVCSVAVGDHAWHVMELQASQPAQASPAALTDDTTRAVSNRPCGVSITGTSSSEKCMRMRSVAALQGRRLGRRAGERVCQGVGGVAGDPSCLPAFLPSCLPAVLPSCLPAFLPIPTTPAFKPSAVSPQGWILLQSLTQRCAQRQSG